MAGRRDNWIEQIFKSSASDVSKLRGLGITDSATATFLIRAREGLPMAQALNALLTGRSLGEEDLRLVCAILEGLLKH